MHILLILWEPNEKWSSLPQDEQVDYLRSLDDAIKAARSNGVMTLGWSKVDRSLNKAPEQGYVGVFAMRTEQDIRELDRNIQQSRWYDYFDSVNISINLEGETEPEPHRVYAKLLGMET